MLHLFAFLITMLIGYFAFAVMDHMVRKYWRKAWAALTMQSAPPLPRRYRRRSRSMTFAKAYPE